MKISYVLPVYNGSSVLATTIDSLLDQDHKDFEIIVVNDCSNDDIEFLAKHYSKKENVRWYDMDVRGGGAKCRNYGNAQAIGDIIAVCDAGDFFFVNRGRLIDDFFTENENIDLVYTHVQVSYPFNMTEPVYVQEAVPWDGEGKPPISHPTVAYRREVADSVRYHEDSLNTDFYEFFMHDALARGFEFGIIPRITCIKVVSSKRDIKKAKDEKYEKYQIYGIDISRERV